MCDPVARFAKTLPLGGHGQHFRREGRLNAVLPCAFPGNLDVLCGFDRAIAVHVGPPPRRPRRACGALKTLNPLSSLRSACASRQLASLEVLLEQRLVLYVLSRERVVFHVLTRDLDRGV